MSNNIAQTIKTFCEENSNKKALHIRRIFRLETYTYEEMWENTLKVNTYLDNLNINRGDNILIWGPNMPEWVFLLFGAFVRGVTVIPINVHTEEDVINKYIEQTKPKALFKSKFMTTETKIKIEKIIILEDLIEIIEFLNKTEANYSLSEDTIAEIVFTSGTTGKPKGVLISHKNITFELARLTKLVNLNGKRCLSILPLSHVMEQMIGLFVPLATGATIYYIARLNPNTIIKAFERYKITHAAVVPQILKIIIENIEHTAGEKNVLKLFKFVNKSAGFMPFNLRKYTFFSVLNKFGGKLEGFAVGSAPLDLHIAKAWENMGVKILEGYGASETTGAVTTNSLDKRVLGSVGKPLPEIEVKIAKNGEIIVKGENISTGYYQNEEKTKEVFKNEYYYTGDIGYFKGGYLYLTGRSNFKIVTAAGDKVYPEDIEKKLNEDPLVKESCVFGITKGDGEIVYASVILKNPERIEEVIVNVNAKLQKHQQILEYGNWNSSEFPRLNTLKINRKQVKEKTLGEFKTEEVNSITKAQTKDKLIKLIEEVCKANKNKIEEDSLLVTDLDMDSLRRVALIALIEEEYQIEVAETELNEETTVSELRNIIEKTKKASPAKPLPTWTINPFINWLRELLRKIIFIPIEKFYIKGINIEGKENLNLIKNPSIIVFNHVGHFDSVVMETILPVKIRSKLFGIADSKLYRHKVQGFMLYLLGHAYPIDKTGQKVKRTLDRTVDLIESGWSLILSPEGGISRDGTLQQLKNGASMLAIETGIPVIPLKLEGYRKLYPEYHEEIQDFKIPLPKSMADLTIKVGRPIYFDRKTKYEEASEIIFKAINNL